MLKYSVKRLLQSVVTVFIVVTLVFLLMRLLPEEGYFGDNYDKLTVEQRQNILRKFGLLDPWYIQLKNFYASLLRGDLGKSIRYRPDVPVIDIIRVKIPYSVAFGLGAIALSLLVGLSMGIHMARNKGQFWDKVWSAYVVFINAVPAAVYLLFIQLYVTSIKVGGRPLFPMLFNRYDPRSWVLPLISMSLGSSAGYALWMRRYMVDQLNQDYIRLARAKGLSDKQIMVRHVLRNAFVPMAQYLPSSILLTISGSIYIESLYSIPGMGGLLVDVIQRQDNVMVQSLVLIYSTLGIWGLFLGDILMALFDPRIRLEKREGAR